MCSVLSSNSAVPCARSSLSWWSFCWRDRLLANISSLSRLCCTSVWDSGQARSSCRALTAPNICCRLLASTAQAWDCSCKRLVCLGTPVEGFAQFLAAKTQFSLKQLL